MQKVGKFWAKCILVTVLIVITTSAPEHDIVGHVPGYPTDFPTKVYAGYLDTLNQTRKLHYVFVESKNGANNKDPITLWLNGGPGCSSLLGFLQQIGPYYLDDGKQYKSGDNLTENPFSWHQATNLLFIESPAGVGYSYSNDANFTYNDLTTANDNEAAVLNFFEKFPEYQQKNFWIAGESYAGKYIPDLAVRIDAHNNKKDVKKIHIQGIVIGNGIMDWTDGSKQKSVKEFMMAHDFIDPDLEQYYNRACLQDASSAGCQYFEYGYNLNMRDVNPYGIYGYCYYNDTRGKNGKRFLDEATILSNIADGRKPNDLTSGKNGAPCLYLSGVHAYFNTHQEVFHAPAGWEWNGPCAQNISEKYTTEKSGSMYQYVQLLSLGYMQIVLYNGDWDAAVTYTDTEKNLLKLNLVPSYLYTPFFIDDQHAGFLQVYSGIKFTIIKGASHMVPQSKRHVGLHIFKAAIGADELQQTPNGSTDL